MDKEGERTSEMKIGIYTKSFLLAVAFMFALCAFTDVTYNVVKEIKVRQQETLIREQYKELQMNRIHELTRREREIKDNLIASVDEYIREVAPGSKIKGSVIVEMSLKHDFDISLLLAQAHIEAHFATLGRLARTNSAFGVGAYDNGHDACVYNDPNESIEPYILLVKKSYLKYSGKDIEKRAKDINRLLNSNYKSKSGKLYAQNEIYGAQVRALVNNIESAYGFRDLQQSLYDVYDQKAEALKNLMLV